MWGTIVPSGPGLYGVCISSHVLYITYMHNLGRCLLAPMRCMIASMSMCVCLRALASIGRTKIKHIIQEAQRSATEGLMVLEIFGVSKPKQDDLSDCENPRFTERTYPQIWGRSHRLPHVCTIMISGNLGGSSLEGNGRHFTDTYMCPYAHELWIISDIWVSQNVDIREIHDDIPLKRGFCLFGKVTSLTSCY